MNLLRETIYYLFGGGTTVLSLYLTVLLIDIITGYMKALKQHNWRSALNIEGLLIKFVTFFTIISADVIDGLAPLVNVSIPINVAFWWTIILTLYELGSILENVGQMGINIGFLSKYLGVLQDQVELKKEEKKDE